MAAQPPARPLPARIRIRPAAKDDAPALADVFFRAFNAPFFQYLMPDTPALRAWWAAAWRKGLDNPTDRTFVAVDTEAGGDGGAAVVVGFSRWQVPQPDGSLEHDSWPPMQPGDGCAWDMDIIGPFFGGMDVNREALMGKKPHWCTPLSPTPTPPPPSPRKKNPFSRSSVHNTHVHG